MSVHDSAKALAKSLKQSEEYKNYKTAFDKVKSDKKTDSTLKDLRNRQVELQRVQMSGAKLEEAKVKKVQDLYNLAVLNPVLSDFFQAEFRFMQTMDDVYKLIGEAVDLNNK